MKYALYLGCTVPVRAPNYELAARKVAEEFGIELVDISDFACCGFPAESVNKETALLLAAKNLSLAEEQGLNICTLCNACTVTLSLVNRELREDDELRAKINKKLSVIGRSYDGKVEVKHFARMLYDDVGVDKIRERVKSDLSGLKFATYYGCHYLKPTEVFGGFDDPENPRTLDQLIEATGAESAFYESRTRCCGGGVLGVEETTALKMVKATLDSVKVADADGMVLICPFCDVMFEQNQKKIEKQFESQYGLPVMYLPQLLGLAMGVPSEELGFQLNRVKPEKLFARVAG